jgi:hypothetical protein
MLLNLLDKTFRVFPVFKSHSFINHLNFNHWNHVCYYFNLKSILLTIILNFPFIYFLKFLILLFSFLTFFINFMNQFPILILIHESFIYLPYRNAGNFL